MSDSAAPHLVDLRDLRLDTAHALVSQVNGGGPATASDYAHPRQYLQGLIDGLCELSLKDPLTGLANRRHFRAVLEREIDRVTRSGEAALLLMLDIDHFKQINDQHGHMAGDQCLCQFADAMRQVFRRQSDSLLRLGGEEFGVLMPGIDLEHARQLGEQFRLLLAEHGLKTQEQPLRLTTSLGLGVFDSTRDASADAFFSRVDDALYQAKHQGRNRLCLA